ncbi:MAG: hypothetical protein H7Z10_12755, partial [Gemmatimonadaceae bacterium]|nr:hypothetical protein [Acetobacteraceae bacterium]
MIPRLKPARFRAEQLFQPQSMAILGVETALGEAAMRNMLAAGFKGVILPVGRDQAVQGVLAYPDVASLPVAPSLAIIATGPDAVAPALL